MTAKQTAQAYYDLGNAYSRLGEQDKATAAYLNALKLDGSLLQASYNLARAYIESGSVAKAVDLLDGLLAKDPKNLTVLDTLGYANYKKGDKARSLGYYDQVLALSPVDENALYNRSMILSEDGKVQEAIDGFRKLYSINSDPNLLLLLGKLELTVDEPDKGIHDLEAYRAAKPDDFEGLKVLADAYRGERLYDKALNAYNAAIAIKPKDAGVLFPKAEILLTAIQDEANGLAALKAALDAGFADRKAVDTLLANPELVGKHAVETLLESKNLFTAQPSGDSATPPSKG